MYERQWFEVWWHMDKTTLCSKTKGGEKAQGGVFQTNYKWLEPKEWLC